MKSKAVLGCLLTAACLLAGCGENRLVMPNTEPGKVLQGLVGSGDQLARQGRIDLHERIPAEDTVLDVWVIRAAEDAPAQRGTAVVLHGLGESKAQYLGAARQIASRGFDTVLIDLPRHGQSEGKYVTYGARESRAVKEVLDRLIEAGEVRPEVYVFGVNLGAAAGIQYAAIDPRVEGVIAVAPYKDFRSVAKRAYPLADDAELERILARAATAADFDPAEASSVEAARKLTVPLLLVHGLVDLSVPLESSRAIRDAAGGPAKLLVVTPGPEQIALALAFDAWAADRVEQIATEGLAAEKPPAEAATQPAAESDAP